jgi:imidazolonepropionase-like amidohydrolase
MQKTNSDDEGRADTASESGSIDRATCSDGDSRFFVAAGIIDGSGAALRRDVVVEVRHGLIVAIQTAARPPQGAMAEDFSHCLLLPAVIDASVLLARSPSLGQPEDEAIPADPRRRATLVERHLAYCHGHGVLGLAVGDDPALLEPDVVQRATSRGLLDVRLSASSCGDEASLVPKADEAFLRVFYSADIDATTGAAGTWQPMDEEQRRTLLRNRGRRKAVAVANGEEAVAAALAEGCDAIEQGYFMGEDNLRAMAAGGMLWIPSLVRAKNGLDGAGEGGDIACRFSQRYLAPGKAAPGAAEFWKKALAEQLGRLSLARSLGVRTALGSGAGNGGLLHGEALIEEMKLFQKAGYPLGEIFQAAAENAARFFAMERLGMLAPGRPATFLVTRGTAQQLPRKLYFLQAIVVDGRPCPVYRRDPVKVVAGSRSGG